MSGQTTTLYKMTEKESAHARSVIDAICASQGETFNYDPYFQDSYTPPIDLKVELEIKAQTYAATDPDFTVFYVMDHESEEKRNAIKSSAIVNTGRYQNGTATSVWFMILLVLYALPHIFTMGLSGFVGFIKKTYKGIYHCEVLGELCEHLGVKMSETYQLEYLATHWGQTGKGYGAVVMKALNEMADANGRHVILYSSSKKNCPFYKRHGYEPLREIGDNVTLFFRRCN